MYKLFQIGDGLVPIDGVSQRLYNTGVDRSLAVDSSHFGDPLEDKAGRIGDDIHLMLRR